MARAHFVKKCRKTIRGTGIKKGDSYYWYKFRTENFKHYSKTQPKPSQLTQSPFLSQIYSITERIEECGPCEGLQDLCDEIKSELQELNSECEEKISNMPESLQQGPTGELLQERADGCNDAASEFDSIDFSGEPDEGQDDDEDDISENSNFWELRLDEMLAVSLPS